MSDDIKEAKKALENAYTKCLTGRISWLNTTPCTDKSNRQYIKFGLMVPMWSEDKTSLGNVSILVIFYGKDRIVKGCKFHVFTKDISITKDPSKKDSPYGDLSYSCFANKAIPLDELPPEDPSDVVKVKIGKRR